MIRITGAPGNVGTELVKLLMAGGVPFRAMVRSPEAAPKIQARAGVEIVTGDFNDRDDRASPDRNRPGASPDALLGLLWPLPGRPAACESPATLGMRRLG